MLPRALVRIAASCAAVAAVSECRRALGLIGDVARLPPTERRLAIRLLFESVSRA